MATRRIRFPEEFGREAASACETLLGRTAETVEWPASRSRRSVRVVFADGSVIATRRKRRERAQLEAHVMQTLHAYGGPVPAVLAFDGEWLVQECIEGTRLPNILVGDDVATSRKLLEAAAAGLARIHEIGNESGLNTKVVRLGVADSWIAEFIDTPLRIGAALEVPAPALDVAAVVEWLAVGPPCFLKWDARPGNAMVRPDGSVVWFDWEHCGARNAPDDFAWLLADEYVPDIAGLIEIAVANAPVGLSAEDARIGFTTYATFHTAVRLALVVHHKADGPWWDDAMCLREDKVRVTEAGARILCARGAELAACNRATEPLSEWFGKVAAQLGAG